MTDNSNNSIPYFQQLMEVGIVHLSPESVSKKVNDNWENVILATCNI